MTGRKETGRKETGRKEIGCKETGRKETGAIEKRAKETGGKATGTHDSQETRWKDDMLMEKREMLPGDTTASLKSSEGIRCKSCSEVVIERVRRRARVFVGDWVVRKTDRVIRKGDDMMVCFSGAKIEAIIERVDKIMGRGKGEAILVDVGTNNAEREGTTVIVRKYMQLVRTLTQTRVAQVSLSWMLPVMGSRGQGYRNCRRMAINTLIQQLRILRIQC